MILDQILIARQKDEAQSYTQDKKSDRPLRSVIKALSWRLIGTIDTLLVSYLLTGELLLASSIASVDFVTKLVLYFVHERIWNSITWGK